jgi:hypothetical protein
MLAGTLSGLPSTTYNLLHRRPVLEAARAAGNVVLPAEAGTLPLLAAGAAAHAALSLGWSAVITGVARRSSRPVMAGAACGLAIAALDLGAVAHGVARRRMALIRDLPVLPQVADHVAFGLVVGFVADWGGGPTSKRDARQGRGPTP